MERDLKLPSDGPLHDMVSVNLKDYRHTRRSMDKAAASLAESILKLLKMYKHEFPPYVLKRYRQQLHDALRTLRTFSRDKVNLYREIAGEAKVDGKSRHPVRKKMRHRTPSRLRGCRRRRYRKRST